MLLISGSATTRDIGKKMDKLTLIYVDDEEINLTNFKLAFNYQYNIHTFLSGEDALSFLHQSKDNVAIVIADQRMPGMSGTEFLEQVNKISPQAIRLMLTAFSDPPDIIDAINKGEVYSYLRKPWKEETLLINLQKAAEKYTLQQQNRNLIKELFAKNQALEQELRIGQQLKESLIRRDMILEAINETAQKLIRSRQWQPFAEPLIARLGIVMAASRVHIYHNYYDNNKKLRAVSEFNWFSEAQINQDKTDIAHDFNYQNVDLERWPLLFDNNAVLAATIDDLPGKEANRLQQINIQSLVCAPINFNNQTWGFLCVVDCYKKREWYEEELESIKSAASLISEAVHREEMEHDLHMKKDQLAHAGRLNVIGEMTEGMAHEIDGAMALISLHADHFKEYFQKNIPDSKEMELARDMSRQVNKTMRMIEDMRNFAKLSPKHLSEINLYWPTVKALSFFREQFRLYLITLTENLTEEIPFIKSDSQLFGQIVVNLLSNARNAVQNRAKNSPASYQMEIKINLYEGELTKEIRNRLIDVLAIKEATSVIFLEIIDNGIGMTKEVLRNCTKAFFTTKPKGSGTGLGLSITKALIQELGFILEIESEPEKGSTFRVMIPTQEKYPELHSSNIVQTNPL